MLDTTAERSSHHTLDEETGAILTRHNQLPAVSECQLNRARQIRNIVALLLPRFVSRIVDSPHHDGSVGLRLPHGLTYRGSLPDGAMTCDNAVLHWPAHAVEYRGQVRDGLPSGRGEFHWLASGDIYKGEVLHGRRHGRGRHERADGASYNGQWVAGRPEGRGRMHFAQSGGVYDGQWSGGKRSGFGEREYRRGVRYVGDWRDGRAHGRGAIRWNHSGMTGVGGAEDWCEVYQGQWCQGVAQGVGHHVWIRGRLDPILWIGYNQYFGEFEAGQRHGSGVFRHCSGAVYRGRWWHNEMAPLQISDSTNQEELYGKYRPEETGEKTREIDTISEGAVEENQADAEAERKGENLHESSQMLRQNKERNVECQIISPGSADIQSFVNSSSIGGKSLGALSAYENSIDGSPKHVEAILARDLLLTSACQMHLESFLLGFSAQLRARIDQSVRTVLRRFVSRLIGVYEYFASRGRSLNEETFVTMASDDQDPGPMDASCHSTPAQQSTSLQADCPATDMGCDLAASVCASMNQLQWWYMLYECRLINLTDLSPGQCQTLLIQACGLSDTPADQASHPLTVVRFGHFLTSLVLLSAQMPLCPASSSTSPLVSDCSSDETVLRAITERLVRVLRRCACPTRARGQLFTALRQLSLPLRHRRLDSWFGSYRQLLTPITSLAAVCQQLAAGRVPALQLVSRRTAVRAVCRHLSAITSTAVEHGRHLTTAALPVATRDTEVSFVVYCEVMADLWQQQQQQPSSNVDVFKSLTASGTCVHSDDAHQLLCGVRVLARLNRLRAIADKSGHGTQTTGVSSASRQKTRSPKTVAKKKVV